MTGSGVGLVARGLRERVARVRLIVRRATWWPFAVRAGVFGAAVAAQGFAYPIDALLGSSLLGLLGLALLPALWPRTASVSVFWLITAGGWILSSTLFDTASLPRLVGVAATLYAVHSGAALAAVLPYDAVVDVVVLARWTLRAGGVVVVALGASVGGLYAVTDLSERTYLAATLLGLVPVVGLLWLLAVVIARVRR